MTSVPFMRMPLTSLGPGVQDRSSRGACPELAERAAVLRFSGSSVPVSVSFVSVVVVADRTFAGCRENRVGQRTGIVVAQEAALALDDLSQKFSRLVEELEISIDHPEIVHRS